MQIEEVSSEEIEDILDSINRELIEQKNRIINHSHSVDFFEPAEPRFILDQKKRTSKKEPSFNGWLAKRPNADQFIACDNNNDVKAVATKISKRNYKVASQWTIA